MAFLDQHPALGYPVAAGLGLLVGSFLNVVIVRLPARMEWAWKREARQVLEQPELYDPAPPGVIVEPSHCPHCQHRLRWYENIPVASFLLQRGRCRHCGERISLQYPVVELLTALLCVMGVWQFGFGWQGFGAAVLACFLVALAGIDLRTRYLPDSLTQPLLWLGLIASTDRLYHPAKPAVIGAALGYLSLWSVCWLYRQVTGRQGMGQGDFKLLAALGAWVGWQGVPAIILLSALLGAVFGLFWLQRRRASLSAPFPFGPCLAVAGWVVFLWGRQITDAYLAWAGAA